ncbi:retrovirus-related Pol polyprotein from transposon TNT 1-94 [Gossypium australe]|uniref:Retrovirus-related Pol polyprotein from transposon TNT 1-94 n=1 Tax=Gossypium australe TaxID=47621 RepID=A0A5B6W1B7_9ROSI|nr:retrovirus-related Pol polyprotein from transposon TNT 1-94 [Gossypium australe]
MEEEIKAVEKNGTWEMVNLPKDKSAIGLKWVFKTKVLQAKGYAQQHGVNFEETFSLVARFETVRLVLALAAQLQWPVYQFDVKSAFLNEDL